MRKAQYKGRNGLVPAGDEVQRRRARVSELLIENMTQAQIAEQIYEEELSDKVLSDITIKKDVSAIRTMWQERTVTAAEIQFAEADASLRHIETEHWKILRGTLTPDEKARHLAGALKALNRRIKLRGLDKPDLSARLNIDYNKLTLEQKTALALGAPLMEVTNM